MDDYLSTDALKPKYARVVLKISSRISKNRRLPRTIFMLNVDKLAIEEVRFLGTVSSQQ